jgi:Asp-tRNA(Asn)/Glu-tRNA(Gln) amidotransferase A subunit family amidase
MSQASLLEADLDTLQAAMDSNTLTSAALVSFYLQRIERYNHEGVGLNAVQYLNPDALIQAQASDAERAAKGPRSALHGIPVLVKDNYETIGMPTSAGSILFAGHNPPRDAYQVARLKAAGAIILGKTTMHEFAYGITNQGSRYGSAKNPYAPERNPGGSSGGTGAAIAANFASVGMGSDTCGSIRIPAAQNNLVGLRGTQGLSSRSGIIPLSSTQDIGGPLARSVKDLAHVLDATVGFDAGDLQTAESTGKVPLSYYANLQSRSNIRVGVLVDWMHQDAEDLPVANVVRNGLNEMAKRQQWQLQDIASPALEEALQQPLNGHFVLIHDFKHDIKAYLDANPSLGYASLDDIIADGRCDPSISASLQASASMNETTWPTYWRERVQRQTIRRHLLALLAAHELDALVYPTIRQIAAPIGDEQMGTNCRLAANSGLPAISVPVGFVDGVPVGLELLAESWSEAKLLDLALTVEQTLQMRRQPANMA